MTIEKIMAMDGALAVMFLAGVVMGGLAAFLMVVRKAGERKTALAVLKESLRAKTAEMDNQRAALERAEKETDALRDRYIDLSKEHAAMEILLKSEQNMAREKAALLEEMTARMSDVFHALSAKALSANNQAFIHLAGETFARYAAAAKNDFEIREKAVRDVIRPVAEALENYDRQVRAMENAREKAYGELSQQVVHLSHTQNALQRETGKLVTALRSPHVRGRWGEITLRRVVEIAGMQNRCDFMEQQAEQNRNSRARPDMIIHLPGDRNIVVDSKVPLMAYLDSLEVENNAGIDELLARHAAHVRSHIQQLALKEYWTRFQPTPEFVVLFMPGENFFSAALAKDPGLIEDAADKGVILATPTTLISLLKAVAYGWKQENAAENARVVSALGNELYGRLVRMVTHFNSLGNDLEKCVTTYNKAVGSLERRVLPSARKFEDLGVVLGQGNAITRLSPVDNKPRRMETEAVP